MQQKWRQMQLSAPNALMQRLFAHNIFGQCLYKMQNLLAIVCAFVLIFGASQAFAKSLDFVPKAKSSQNPPQKEPKPFSLNPDSIVIAPDSRLKSHNPPSENPASDMLNPDIALHKKNQAHTELLDSSVIPQYLPKGKMPAPLLPPPALTPYTALDSSEPLQKREFIISYKALSQNGIITGEKYNISSPLISKASLPIAYTCSIDTPINDLVTDDEAYAIKYVLYFYQDEVLSCLRKSGASVLSYARTANATHISDDTLLSVPAKRILAYFDNRYLILEILKELK